MQSRSRPGRLSLVLLFVGIFAFWWGIAVFTQNDKVTPAVSNTAAPASDTTAYDPESVSGPLPLQVTLKDNVYTYSGSLPLASSCDQLGTGIAVSGTDPSHVTILLTLTKPSIACAEASGGTNSQPFAVSLSVKPGAKAILDGLTVNGIIVATSIAGAKTK